MDNHEDFKLIIKDEDNIQDIQLCDHLQGTIINSEDGATWSVLYSKDGEDHIIELITNDDHTVVFNYELPSDIKYDNDDEFLSITRAVNVQKVDYLRCEVHKDGKVIHARFFIED